MKKIVSNETTSINLKLNPTLEDALNEDKQRIAKEQNKIISDFCVEKLGAKPYCVTRDKEGHIIIIERQKPIFTADDPRFFAYMLGLNKSNCCIDAFPVGYCEFHYQRYNIKAETMDDYVNAPFNTFHISMVAVHPSFERLGIGALLLQTVENYGAYKGIEYIRLNSLRHFTIDELALKQYKKYNAVLSRAKQAAERSDAQAFVSIIDKLGDSKLPEFIRQNSFDRNLYFYYKNGFERVEKSHLRYDPMLIGVQKENLSKHQLDLGAEPSTLSFDTKDKRFAMAEQDNPINLFYKSFAQSLYSPELNDYPASNFMPLDIPLDEEGRKELENILRNMTVLKKLHYEDTPNQ